MKHLLFSVTMVLGCSIAMGQSTQDRTALMHSVFLCKPISLNVSSEYSTYAKQHNMWQTVISGGTSAVSYPYFLFRTKVEDSKLEIVFFDEEGKGYFVRADAFYSDNSINATINRKGGGEGGRWELWQALQIVSGNTGNLSVIVNGSEKSTKLGIFSRRKNWSMEFSFSVAAIDKRLIDIARKIDKPLIIND